MSTEQCDPDRSGGMRSYPATTHTEKMAGGKVIRDTPEGRRLAKEWSRDPVGGKRRRRDTDE